MIIVRLVLFLLIGTSFAIAQQKPTFKIDTSAIIDRASKRQFNLLHWKNLDFLLDEIKKNPNSDFVLQETDVEQNIPKDNMPVHEPQGHFKFRVFEVDSTKNYYLRIIKVK
ncbi:hypothetical protein ABN763_17380 [Spongiivirga sp. MCCC 1A20706]|uniref:hypothetical protein n=1 Tax=Spongiivirga sp. MCCC 1A20706 TaxID=3160963 RepID=UPI0039778057